MSRSPTAIRNFAFDQEDCSPRSTAGNDRRNNLGMLAIPSTEQSTIVLSQYEQLVAELDTMFHGNTISCKRSMPSHGTCGSGVGYRYSEAAPTDAIVPGRWRWRERVARLAQSDDRFQRRIRNLIVANSIGAILEQLDHHCEACRNGGVRLTRSRFVPPPMRYYRQTGTVWLLTQIDTGEAVTLTMFLRSLTDRERADFQAMDTRMSSVMKVVNRFAGGHMTLRIETVERSSSSEPSRCRRLDSVKCYAVLIHCGRCNIDRLSPPTVNSNVRAPNVG